MHPETRSSPRPKDVEPNKKGSKRKRLPSENLPEESNNQNEAPKKVRAATNQNKSKRKGQSNENEKVEVSKEKKQRKNKEPKKVNASTKKGSKRKRQSSENESVAASEKVSQHDDEVLDVDEFNDESEKNRPNGEDDYGKFEKYNKDKLWKLKKIAHHLLPSFNITKNTNINNVRQFPLMQISFPHCVFVNSKFHENIDVCHRRTLALNSYMNRLKIVKTAYLAAKKRNKNIRKDEKRGIYCKPLLDFAERRELHPDKYFVQDYDFYYTGGNLCINNRSSQIAHVGGMHMNTLVLNVRDNIPKAHRLTSIDFKNAPKDECEIFEVQSSLCDNYYFFLRQKYCVSIQEFRNSKFTTVQNFKNKEVPFISFTQDPVNTHHLAISDLVHKVRVCDLEKGVPIQTLKLMPREEIKTSNNWNMIKSLDSHVYIYSARKKVSIIDTRLPESEWKSNYCGLSEEKSCYNLCSIARSKFDHLFYIGSSHKAYCVDRRYMGKDIDSKNAAVACWTHQMSSFPLMMATICHNDAEYIALQSPLNSDLRILENMQILQDSESNITKIKSESTDLSIEYSYESPCLPYMPPSLELVFQKARLQGKCIKQGTGLYDRVKACITGLDFSEDGSSRYLLTATSNGDIFARHMCNSDEDVKPDTATAADVMSRFEDTIFQTVRKTPLATTEVCNLSGISKVFRCPAFSVTNQAGEIDYPTKRKYMGRWQKSIYSLSKYKDALASDLISIWDFDIEDDKGINITALNRTENGDAKVSGWLEEMPEIAHSTMLNMTSIPMDVFNSSNLNSTVADISLDEFVQMNSISQPDLPPSAPPQSAAPESAPPESALPECAPPQFIPNKPKIAKKKSRYIKGF